MIVEKSLGFCSVLERIASEVYDPALSGSSSRIRSGGFVEANGVGNIVTKSTEVERNNAESIIDVFLKIFEHCLWIPHGEILEVLLRVFLLSDLHEDSKSGLEVSDRVINEANEPVEVDSCDGTFLFDHHHILSDIEKKAEGFVDGL